MSANTSKSLGRRQLFGAAAGALALPKAFGQQLGRPARLQGRPTLVGSANCLPGMQEHYAALKEGAHPLDVAIDVVKIVEADPNDMSVGLGGLPNEDGEVTLDAAVMDGASHNAGSVSHLKNILHPVEVARLVMERTDHVQLVDEGAYRFARMHGHAHTELLTEAARKVWVRWKESMSDRDDRLAPQPKGRDQKNGQLMDYMGEQWPLEDLATTKRLTGTIHCSALSAAGTIACCTTTSGLAWKIPGRVGDSPVIGAGLYCDSDAGSAGATGRGEAAILSAGSAMIVELLRQGASPLDAGRELLRRVSYQAKKASVWQPGLVNDQGLPTFNLQFYVLGLDGRVAGVELLGNGRRKYAVSDSAGGPRLESLVPFHEQ